MRPHALILGLSLGLSLALSTACAQSLDGLWDATVEVNGITIPFRMEFGTNDRGVTGSFFNGDDKVSSTGGSLKDGAVSLYFAHYATRLEAKIENGTLVGRYDRGSKGFYPFQAKRFAPSPLAAEDVPSIAGRWDVEVKSSKGELAWRFIVRQAGPEVSAAILRVDGDTGLLTGAYRDGHFVLSHFSGARPSLFEVTPNSDGTLAVKQNGKDVYTAVRSNVARAKGLPEPTDPSKHTSVKDPTEPFRFSGPDLAGKLITEADARFRGKVVIVDVMGSWCPNCHDEAPFLVELYRKYHAQGLEVVALSFEEAEQLKDPVRLRSFIRNYGIGFTVLMPGEPAEVKEKLPQALNLNSWPTTFFLGRDGRVRSVHAGFAGPASGEFHNTLKEEVTATVEKLLAENTVTTR